MYPLLLCLLATAADAAELELVEFGSDWAYLDAGVPPGPDWAQLGFDDSGWASGAAPLGYGDGDETTVVGFGPDPDAKHPTTWFRTEFDVANPSAWLGLELQLRRDDGAVVYLNGVEVQRSNLPPGPILPDTWALLTISGADEDLAVRAWADPALLVPGTNVVAVELHQQRPTSSDLGLDLAVVATDTVAITRGPYLQRATPTSVVVRWRTGAPTSSTVWFGPTQGALTLSLSDATWTTEHEITLAGLTPSSTYTYAVGSGGQVLAGDDGQHHFSTHPEPGARVPTRIWAIGDSGTANAEARAVRDAWKGFSVGHPADVWLMLGDNAYDDGTDEQYQAAVFDTYPGVLRNTVVWPTMGNHDGRSAHTAEGSGPYYDIFTLPTRAEAGGLPSWTEGYYSFDHGNVHFVCLNSQDVVVNASSAMVTWLEADLAASQADWTVVYFHHPPYTKGTHDSDWEPMHVLMRTWVLPVLEDHGVDLVLGGHSHGYERSMLVAGHYGQSTTFETRMLVDPGDGDPAGDGAYTKVPGPRDGAVYVVAGSSGRVGSGTYDHPVMVRSLQELGSVVVDIDGDTLAAIFLDDEGGSRDLFHITKPLAPIDDPAADEEPGDSDAPPTDSRGGDDVTPGPGGPPPEGCGCHTAPGWAGMVWIGLLLGFRRR